MMKSIGILGASSNVGKILLNKYLTKKNQIYLYQYKNKLIEFENSTTILKSISLFLENLEVLISVIPIWELKDILIRNQKSLQIKKLILLSSTSASTKFNSKDIWERNYAKKFLDSEKEIQYLCNSLDINCLILRPSMIWGNKKDLNISFIMKFISKFGFLILPSKGNGNRYPIHVNQLADSIIDISNKYENGIFNILGPEEINYKKMCEKIFSWYGYYPFILTIPKNLQKYFLFFSKYILRKPYINESSFTRIDKNLYINLGNPINFIAKGTFQAGLSDLYKKKIFGQTLQIFLKNIKYLFKNIKKLNKNNQKI